jgi:SAM-dependent methyltransferase
LEGFVTQSLLSCLPPPALRERVTGSVDPTSFIESGARTLDEWNRALEAVNVRFADANSILDFGCGCGRVLQHLKSRTSQNQRIWGADVDEESINWININLDEVEAIHLPDQAPSSIPDNFIDIVASHSVFTHLPEVVGLNWLADLHRITKPGGIVLTSIHGRKVAREFFQFLVAANRFGEAVRFFERFNTFEFYYLQGRSSAEEPLPEYYGHAFHNFNYIDEHWLPDRFQLLAFLPVASLSHQDILVLRKI